MAIGIACFAIFLVMAALMYSRKISALLALPVMAVAIALVGGIPAGDVLKDVISGGSVKLHNAYTASMIGAILAELINKQGIAKAMVRWVAEFAGDSPYILGILMTAVTALLFSSLGGLGAVIMVGTVILPVMLSLGIPAATAGGLFLFGISLGGMFNLANWTLYIDVLGIRQSQIILFVLPFAGILFAVAAAFLLFELKKLANIKYAVVSLLLLALPAAVLWHPSAGAAEAAKGPLENSVLYVGIGLAWLCLYAFIRHQKRDNSLPAAAFLTPLIPLALVLAARWEIMPAFIAGIAYGTLVTWKRDSVNTLTRSIIEGAQSVIPAVILMMGIGMLLAAVMHKNIATAIEPLLTSIIPVDPLMYILTFTALAPLALYRGPLSLWGMGSGLVALIKGPLGALPTMSMLLSVGQLQGISDPTNTHNVWIATYLGTDPIALLRKTLPYAWAATILGLVLSVSLGFMSQDFKVAG